MYKSLKTTLSVFICVHLWIIKLYDYLRMCKYSYSDEKYDMSKSDAVCKINYRPLQFISFVKPCCCRTTENILC